MCSFLCEVLTEGKTLLDKIDSALKGIAQFNAHNYSCYYHYFKPGEAESQRG